MNIIHVESSPGWGGQEIRILRESMGMRKRGHTVIFACEKNSGLYRHGKKEGFSVYPVRFKKVFWFYSFFVLLFLMMRKKITLINTHSSSDAWLGGIIGKILSIKVVRTRHLSTPIRKGLNSIVLYNFLADFVVTTCAQITSVIARQSKKDPRYIRSIPTGVDVSSLQIDAQEIENFKKKQTFSSSIFYVGTACFMRSWKGIDDFLEAAHLTQKEPFCWVLIGGGHDEKYRKKAQDLGVTNVVFTGHLSPPFAAIASLDAFALLSTAHEGVSQASLQAAYLQKPLITTPVGGLKEVCIDHQTGIIVPPKSPQKVAAAVRYLYEHPEIRKEMGIQAQKIVEEKFTYQKMLDQMEEVYRQLRTNSN